ncbi:MAG: DUF58 domain-containing protein [Bacteroidetes bacterium QS_8_64_10]|jgi:uncharacterized protein (DUF58 family)|nr:MAG: DUF58 domain-containing protein [Bacteroidetes bacterium QS_8_64_10]
MIPDELFKKIRQIEVRTKGLVQNVFGGEYHTAFKGQGIEFSEVRPYQFGDEIRNIDWNVSARTNDTYVKVYEEEREQTVMLLVDVSGSGNFGTQGKFKREVAAEVCAVIAFSAVQNNDKVGLLLFSDEVELFVPPKKGRRHVLRMVRDLFAYEPDSRGTDIQGALDHLMRLVRRRAVVVLISDFFDAGYEKTLRGAGRRHDLVAVHLQDPREEELPPVGLVDFVDAETGETVTLDTRSSEARERYAEHAHQQRADTKALLRRARVDTVPIRTDEGYVEPLIRFFRQRNRRA